MMSHLRTMILSAPLVVVARVLLFVLVAGAVVAAVVVAGRDGPGGTRRYTCPMHGEVRVASPGDCPICGMALVELGAVVAPRAMAAGADAVALAALRPSAEATQLLRFSVAKARRNTFRGEVYAPAISDADGTVVAQLYRDELASVAADERAELVVASAPGVPRRIRRDDAPPVARGAVMEVRFRVEPGEPALAPDRAGWVKLGFKVRPALVVRSASVVDAPDGPYVLVFSAEQGALARRAVAIGKQADGMTTIGSGLSDKDFVVMANTFSLDAARRLQVAP
jgi:hypothetical protein